MKRGMLIAVGASMSMLSGCGDLSAEDDAAEVETTTSAIRGGTVTLHNPVVGLLALNDKGQHVHTCTGVLISPQYLLTAAHCVAGSLGGAQYGAIYRTVQRYDEAWGQQLATGWNERLWAWVHPDYKGVVSNIFGDFPVGDEDDDLAIVHRIPQPWSNVDLTDTTQDLMRISQGTCTQIDRMTFYGAGFDGFSGENAGLLREMPVNLKGCESENFYDLEGSRAVCRGDSGGPYVVDVGGREMVAGVLALMEVTSGGSQNCAKGDGKQWGTRINSSKMAWIESRVGACGSYSLSGHNYKRCW